MAKFDLKQYARAGAEMRVRELRSELASIFRVFPDLAAAGDSRASGVRRGQPRAADVTEKRRRPTRRRRKMTAVQRKAVSERMAKYWAERRASAKK